MESSAQTGFDADLHRLEVGIRQLKQQYDMFFAGALKLPPSELRAELERLIKRHSERPTARYAQRFHFNTLVGRFQSLSERWIKQMRLHEESGGRRPGALQTSGGQRERLLTRCVLRDPLGEKEALLRLHGRYAEASRKLGQPPVAFDRFVQGIVRQTRELREGSDCSQIELRLVVRDDAVRLTARPGR
jgi:hypothetical protein